MAQGRITPSAVLLSVNIEDPASEEPLPLKPRAITKPVAALSPGLFGAGGLFGPLSPPKQQQSTAPSAWNKVRRRSTELNNKGAFNKTLANIRKNRASEFDKMFGELRLPRTKRKKIVRVLGQLKQPVDDALARSHSVRKMTRESQKRRRELYKSYKKRRAEVKRELREMATDNQEREREMRKMKKRVLHSRGKVNRAGTQLATARTREKAGVKADFEALASMPSSQVKVSKEFKARRRKRRRQTAAKAGGNSMATLPRLSPIHGAGASPSTLKPGKRAHTRTNSVVSEARSVASGNDSESDGSEFTRGARSRGRRSSIGSVSTAISDATSGRSGVTQGSHMTVGTDLSTPTSSRSRPKLQRSQSGRAVSRRPSLAVMGKAGSSKSIGALTKDRSRSSLFSDHSGRPPVVPETAVLLHDGDLENVTLRSVDMPIVRPLITLGKVLSNSDLLSARSTGDGVSPGGSSVREGRSSPLRPDRSPVHNRKPSMLSRRSSSKRFRAESTSAAAARKKHDLATKLDARKRRKRRRARKAKRAKELESMLQKQMERLSTEQKLKRLHDRQSEMIVEKIEGYAQHIHHESTAHHMHRGLEHDSRFQCRRNIERATALNDGVLPGELQRMLPRVPHENKFLLKKLRHEVDSATPSVNSSRLHSPASSLASGPSHDPRTFSRWR